MNSIMKKEIERFKEFTPTQAKGFIIGKLVVQLTEDGFNEEMAVKAAHAIFDSLEVK